MYYRNISFQRLIANMNMYSSLVIICVYKYIEQFTESAWLSIQLLSIWMHWMSGNLYYSHLTFECINNLVLAIQSWYIFSFQKCMPPAIVQFESHWYRRSHKHTHTQRCKHSCLLWILISNPLGSDSSSFMRVYDL